MLMLIMMMKEMNVKSLLTEMKVNLGAMLMMNFFRFIEDAGSELLYKKVKSDQEAYELYNNYSFKHGFGTRKGKIERRANRVTIRQRFKRVKKYGEEPKVYQKGDFRTGCKAFIQFDVDKESGLFIVVKHHMEHNHSRVPVSKRHLIRSHRKVSGEQVAMLNSLIENGIGVIRKMWCPAYSKEYFSGGIRSSQRSETTNKSVRLHVTHGLRDFYNSFIEVVGKWRGKEGNHDYNSIIGNRHLVWADIGLLEHARKVYTIALY
ncbi:Protein FAR1-RELATED SEQUENCE 5 [Bienertia sinuspersici]